MHLYTLNNTYRGVVGFHPIVLVTDATLPCFGQTRNLKPDATLIPASNEELSP